MNLFDLLFGGLPTTTICGLTNAFAVKGEGAEIFRLCLQSVVEDELNLMGKSLDDMREIRATYMVDDKFMQAVRDGSWCCCDDPNCGGKQTKATVLSKLERFKDTVVYVVPFEIPQDRLSLYRKLVEYLNDGFDFEAAKTLIEVEFSPVTEREIEAAHKKNG